MAHEARVLSAVAHPGVVQLLRRDGDRTPSAIVLRRVPHGPIDVLGPQPFEVVAGLGAALATTVADLHDLGVTHGSIEPSHVLLESDGRPVLCGFGCASEDLGAQSEDLRSLSAVLTGMLPVESSRRYRKLVQSGRSARSLARRLAGVPGARLPGLGSPPTAAGVLGPPSTVAGPTPARRSPLASVRTRWALAAVASVATLAALVGIAPWRDGRTAPSVRFPVVPVLAPCPPVDKGCGPLRTPGGVLVAASRFAVGLPGDVTVMGRWECGTALPGVFRPSTGQLWVFPKWAVPTEPVTGRLVGRVPGGLTVRVVPQRDGCDLLGVSLHDGNAVVLDPRLP